VSDQSPADDRALVTDPERAVRTVLIVGAGLIGTSAGLALRDRGVSVYLQDANAAAGALAADLGAGSLEQPAEDPDLVVLAVPPQAIATLLYKLQRQYLTSTFMDVGSVKVRPQVEAETAGADMSRFVGGHPMAGRERPGPAGARADLFVARPWVLTPGPATTAQSLDRALCVVELCGADLFLMSAERHDEAVALVSHVPQVVASLTAARLNGVDTELIALSGQGIRDVTRIAASDPALWTEILDANAGVVLAVLDALAVDLDRVRGALRRLDDKSTERPADTSATAVETRGELTALLVAGNQGRARIPGKHGGARADYVSVPVVIPDQPGSLASLFVAAGEAGVNVEDVSIEHSPGQRVGLVELLVQPDAAASLAAALRESGWTVHFGLAG